MKALPRPRATAPLCGALRVPLVLALTLGLLGLSGCEWSRKTVVRRPTPPAPPMYINMPVAERPREMLPPSRLLLRPVGPDTAGLRRGHERQRAVEAQLAAQARAEAEARALLEAERLAEAKAEARQRAADKRSGKKPAPVRSEVGEATTAIDLDKYHASVMAMYDDEPGDSEKMREFKALRKKMDEALVKAGYTQQQIKQYYVMQFLGQPDVKPNVERTPVDAGG